MPVTGTFEFRAIPEILCQDGCSDHLGGYLSDRGIYGPVMVVTDKGLRRLGLLDTALNSLTKAGIEYFLFDDIQPDPPEACIMDAAKLARAQNVTAVIGFGGGSSMDVAKLVAVLLKGSQRLPDIYGVGKVTGGRVPLFLIPTTAGTGVRSNPNLCCPRRARQPKWACLIPHYMQMVRCWMRRLLLVCRDQ